MARLKSCPFAHLRFIGVFSQPVKPDFILEAFCGPTEVRPCYKAPPMESVRQPETFA